MLKEITMPAGGQTTDVSTIGTWLVKKGDKVKRGHPLLEIDTDKATLSVESFAKGTVLDILVEEGDEVSAGTVIAYIGEEGDLPAGGAAQSDGAAQSVDTSQTDSAAQTGGISQTGAQTGKSQDSEEEYQPIDKNEPWRYARVIKAMPNAKLIARENGISLEEVADYAGKDILKRQDVNGYLESQKQKTDIVKTEIAEDEIIPLTKMRKVIAKRMLESSQTIPTFQITVEVDMTQCIVFRKLVNGAKDDIKLSFNDILFKCMEAAIRKFPYINSSYTDEAIIVHKDVNIGLAVSIDHGLVVPVAKQINRKNMEEISLVNKENIAKARSGKLSPEDMSGGTITLSNLGMYPVSQFNAIINPPEVCILAIAATEDKPVFVNGEWKAVPTMKITGTFDHRVIDGAYGAEFLAELKKIIETPALALV